MVYPIVVYGDPVLKKHAKDVDQNADVSQLVADMFETMDSASGIGLAAPQVGKSIRLFIVDTHPMEDENIGDYKMVFINPEIIEEWGEEWDFEEGCLSIPTIREDVSRLDSVRIKWFDEHWNKHYKEFDGMVARIIQHEYDHLDGVLFTDHITSFKRRLLKGKLANISRGKVETSYRISAPLANA